MEKQNWAIMADEEKANRDVASACAALLMQVTLTSPPPAEDTASPLQ